MLASYFSSYGMLILTRIIAGIGFSLYFTSGNSLVADYFTLEERGKAYGLHNAGSSMGQILGTLLGGTAAFFFTWQFSFCVFGIIVIILMALMALLFYYYGPEMQTSKNASVSTNSFRILSDYNFWESSLLQAASFSSFLIITTFLPLLLTEKKALIYLNQLA